MNEWLYCEPNAADGFGAVVTAAEPATLRTRQGAHLVTISPSRLAVFVEAGAFMGSVYTPQEQVNKLLGVSDWHGALPRERGGVAAGKGIGRGGIIGGGGGGKGGAASLAFLDGSVRLENALGSV